VPFYNVQDYIAACLESIALQTVRDIEVVLVDDGSRDDSAIAAKAFCDRDPRFRIVAQENQGLGPARNTGVRHSDAEYITFVDSDDLVTRHAFELMLRTLDETGSSFAGGDARRFNNSSGVRESWVHRVPFEKTRKATHISEFPQLALDRMVWNKVYRRSFWDRFGYEFPPIRYEDYPVTLKAHLDAVTVDCLSAPVYYWRERESGDSITQQRFKYTNLLDRVVSAEMVLRLLDGVDPGLRHIVHEHFAGVDLVALTQAFATVPHEDEQLLVALGQRFCAKLDPAVLGKLPSYDRIQVEAVRSGDAPLLRRLAQFRVDSGLHGGARARRRPDRPWRWEHCYPGLTDRPRPVPRGLYAMPAENLRLQTAVSEVRWTDAGLRVTGRADIRHISTGSLSRLRVSLVGDDKRIPLDVRRFPTRDSHGDTTLAGFEVLVDRGTLRTLEQRKRPAYLQASLTSGVVHRTGVVGGLQSGSPLWSHGAWVGDTSWLQPSRGGDGRLALKRYDDPCRLESARADGDAIVVSGAIPGQLTVASLDLARSGGGGATVTVPLSLREDGPRTAFSGRVPLAGLVAAGNPDDPYLQHTVWIMRLRSGDSSQLVLITGLDESVTHVHGSRLVCLSRSPSGFVNVIDSPVRPTATGAALDGSSGELVVSGPAWPAATTGEFEWRHFLEDSDDYVSVPCRTAVDGETWHAAVDLAGVVAECTEQAGTGRAEWTLFTVAPDGAAPLLTDAFLAGRLPLEHEHDGHTVTVRPRTGVFHLEVR
jgi:CDP-glycerol glycerophosphotransferase